LTIFQTEATLNIGASDRVANFEGELPRPTFHAE
jgi:hypothetical protein